MSPLSVCLAMAALWGRASARAAGKAPPPEVLKNLDFFLNYELVLNLPALESAPADAEATASTQTVRAAGTGSVAGDVRRSSATVGGKQ